MALLRKATGRVLAALGLTLAVGVGVAALRSGGLGFDGPQSMQIDPSQWAAQDGERVDPEVRSFEGYDFGTPEASFKLPKELREISGLTSLDGGTVACVQDELGELFLLDLVDRKVTGRVPFGSKGDYEGLARARNALWVLRSDGALTELLLTDGKLTEQRTVELDVGHADFEGLCFDPVAGSLLVAPKDRPAKGAGKRARRVFAVDLASGDVGEGYALETTVDDVARAGLEMGVPIPVKEKKKGGQKIELKLLFSSVAVHPVSGEVYVLSAADAGLFVFGRDSELRGAHFFSRKEMPQAEAMTFMGNGDLVVASEGAGGAARMVVYGYGGGGD